MGQLQAFEAKGKTFSITVGVASAAVPVNIADLGLGAFPQSLQFENTGTADIWVLLSSTAAPTAVFPTPGTTTVGTPQPGFRVRPGAIVVYSLNVSDPTQKVPNVAGTGQGAGFYMAVISSAAAQNLDVTPGEGL